MNFLKKLKRKRLQNRIEKSSQYRDNRFHYLEKNKNIGLIIDASNNETLQLSNNFADYLIKNDNKIEKLYFIKRKTGKKEELPKKTISVYGDKWIRSKVIEEFTRYKFDILFILNFTEKFEVHYLTATANADLKVSPHYYDANYADLTFIIDDNSKPQDFFSAIKKYLVESSN